MTTYLLVTTVANDRWDLIAWRCYGDPQRIEPLIAANPHLPIRSVLPAGETVCVPVLEPAQIASASLPPWKRPSEGAT